MSVVLRLEHVWKQYRLGEIGYGTLRQDLQTWWAGLRGREDPNSPLLSSPRPRKAGISPVYALRDVTLDVEEGKILGIVGANGAGKTTLLRLIAGLTAPSRGRIKIKGRVGTLLAVGAGFHPDLTGRENVYVNGAVLGMTTSEITARFEEIVEFSGVGQYIDTPVKRYSAGMMVRLAFAVAAHLEPEILLVDEVLAVGDAGFRRKCIGKLDAASRGGRTVLFVSHNMGVINQLCTHAAWFDDGMIRTIGPTPEVVNAYVRSMDRSGGSSVTTFSFDPTKEVQIRQVKLLDNHGTVTRRFTCDGPVLIDLTIEVSRTLPGLCGYLRINRSDGTLVMESDNSDTPDSLLAPQAPGMHTIRVTVPPRTLAPGDYHIYVDFALASAYHAVSANCAPVGSFSLTDVVSRRGDRRLGFFSTRLLWELVEQPTPLEHNVPHGMDCAQAPK
jgi:lipopolysaccharide transport system ATP-binding protein